VFCHRPALVVTYNHISPLVQYRNALAGCNGTGLGAATLGQEINFKPACCAPMATTSLQNPRPPQSLVLQMQRNDLSVVL